MKNERLRVSPDPFDDSGKICGRQIKPDPDADSGLALSII